MAQYVPEFNSSNTEDRIQLDSKAGAVKVYMNGAWQSLTMGSPASGSVDSYILGTATPLVAENLPQTACITNVAASLVTTVATAVAIPLVKGQLVTSIGFMAGTTAAS